MMYDELVAWLRSWSELPAHCECYESCAECDKQDICATFTNERIITKAGEAADAIEELQAAEKKYLANISALEAENQHLKRERYWIPVTERLPDYGTTVLVYGSQGGIYTARYERARAEWGRDSWWKLNSKSHICNPTHWMPLPEPPKEET